MDMIEGILTRRSIRDYTEAPVDDDVLKVLLDCAMHAPSAKNEQPWQFMVIKDAAKRKELSETTPYTHMAAKASVVIVVCGDMAEDKAGGFWVQDCSAAIQNLLLAAHAKGLGAVWCGIYPKEDRAAFLREKLGLPAGIIPLGMVCIGHPAKEAKPADRFLSDRVHYEKW